MRLSTTKTKRVIGFLLVIVLFCATLPRQRAEELSIEEICYLAFRKCLSDADFWTWISKGVVGHILYCLNGDAFCERYLTALLK